MEKQLEDVKSKREIIRSLTTKLITKIECIIKDESISREIKIEDLIECKEQLLDKQNSLKKLNEKIESLINSEEIEKEVSSIFRITAWIRRFINNVKLKKEDRIKTPLAAEEIEKAEEIWIKQVQPENFGIEINCLEENKNLPKDSKIRDLNPFLRMKKVFYG
ncbi:hypothetical protein TNCT_198901 [Trichonephila clavata]|uniref:Uncharacterized protein n=1 Tax=Trichonephila clavata TaxID=2740835 RepID=A0A8X6F6E7_TRICU|nr:hypothetical protein TNCT_198901 [Trichonephila clavata]